MSLPHNGQSSSESLSVTMTLGAAEKARSALTRAEAVLQARHESGLFNQRYQRDEEAREWLAWLNGRISYALLLHRESESE